MTKRAYRTILLKIQGNIYEPVEAKGALLYVKESASTKFQISAIRL